MPAKAQNIVLAVLLFSISSGCSLLRTPEPHRDSSAPSAKPSLGGGAEKVVTTVTCGMNQKETERLLGVPDSTAVCKDFINSDMVSLRYGRSWVVFRYDGAFKIVDQADFDGKCPGKTAGLDICD